jgi:hypothetical protein
VPKPLHAGGAGFGPGREICRRNGGRGLRRALPAARHDARLCAPKSLSKAANANGSRIVTPNTIGTCSNRRKSNGKRGLPWEPRLQRRRRFRDLPLLPRGIARNTTIGLSALTWKAQSPSLVPLPSAQCWRPARITRAMGPVVRAQRCGQVTPEPSPTPPSRSASGRAHTTSRRSTNPALGAMGMTARPRPLARTLISNTACATGEGPLCTNLATDPDNCGRAGRGIQSADQLEDGANTLGLSIPASPLARADQVIAIDGSERPLWVGTGHLPFASLPRLPRARWGSTCQVSVDSRLTSRAVHRRPSHGPQVETSQHTRGTQPSTNSTATKSAARRRHYRNAA